MTNATVKGPTLQEDLSDDKCRWFHQNIPSSRKLRRKIVAKAIEIAIITVFSKFVYTFNGQLFLQLDGAPIGTRLAAACAVILMEWVWGRLGK